MSDELVKWSDQAMFPAEDMPEEALTKPRVHLIWATPDPLGAAAAMNNIYEGRVSRSLADVTRAEREQVLNDMQKTVLKLPMENIQFHFLLEGVTRGLTHQLVRQRHAGFAQESTRFAVFGQGVPIPVGLPPSLHGTLSAEAWYQADPTWRRQNMSSEQDARLAWEEAMEKVQDVYSDLIDAGMPAEDARGILPTNLLTRVHWIVNLRALHQYAGLRLSTQAQFEWREVFAGIINAIRNYDQYESLKIHFEQIGPHMRPEAAADFRATADWLRESDRWQWEGIANLFRPVCYYTGKCEFMGTADRHCNIRDRVQANHAVGRPSSEWHEPHVLKGSPDLQEFAKDKVLIPAIHPREWLENPAAARKAQS